MSYLQVRGRLASERATAEIEKSQTALRASEARYRSKIEQSPTAIHTFAPDGASLTVNNAWEKLWGLSADDLRDAHYNVLEDPEFSRCGTLEDIRRAFAGQGVTVGPFYYQPPALPGGRRGRPRWIRSVLYPIKDDRGHVREVVCMHEDLTTRKEAETELQRAKEEAERANQAKDQFLAVLSHELRNPLAPVLMMADVLSQPDVDASHARDALEVIRRNVELEARLIDDLLDITRITRGKLTLELLPADAHTAISYALEICQSAILTRDLAIDLHLDAPAHTVLADPARLQQVFWNLIKNAVKFTPEHGTITIRTSNPPPSSVPGTPSALVIEVTDTGIGIEPAKIGRIFEAFEQADHSITQRFGGLGLGLAISRALIHAHHGTIAATSPGPGQGSTFTVTLPLSAVPIAPSGARPVPLAPRRAPGAAGAADVTPCRLLLVEDQPDSRRALTILLERTGYEVRAAGTAAEALAIARAWEYDILLSDLGLPDASGLELVGAMRAIRATPAIALTGLGMEEDIKAALAAGFTTHLTKPIQFDRLLAVIEALCSAPQAPQA